MAVAASSPVARAGLASLLAEARDLLVLETPDGDGRAPPDVVVLEVAPGASAETALLDLPPGPVVVVLADATEEPAALVRAGARAVLGRDVSGDALVAAVLAVAAGLVVVPADATEALAALPGRPQVRADAALDAPLTPRETEILRLLADGLGNKGIANRLRISEHTVKAHVSAILAKLDAASRAEAVAAGARLGLLLL